MNLLQSPNWAKRREFNSIVRSGEAKWEGPFQEGFPKSGHNKVFEVINRWGARILATLEEGDFGPVWANLFNPYQHMIESDCVAWREVSIFDPRFLSATKDSYREYVT